MSDTLFRRDKESYGSDYQRHLLEQYKLYVASTEKISDRRQRANNYFITINTAILAGLLLSLRIRFARRFFIWLCTASYTVVWVAFSREL